MVVGHQDMAVIDSQALAVPHNSERASTVAAHAAWYAQADAQARAIRANREEASEEARIEAEIFVAESTTKVAFQD